MRFVSTNSGSAPVELPEAIDCCLAADGGMYLPESIPVVPRAFFNNIGEMSLREIAYVVASTFFGQDVPAAELKAMVDESFSFEAPLVKVGDICVLELFHGPTLTFKDYGARFMARLMRYLDGKRSIKRTVLVATTGNTGAAAANGLNGMDGIDVFVLYPKGHLSRMQRAAFGASGGNVHPVEVMGSVEDCKRLIQEAFADKSLSELRITGANSINVARLLPQVVFTCHAYACLQRLGVENAGKAVYSLPCGNLSNLVAAVMARRCGLPSGRLIAATNINNGVGRLLQGETKPSDPEKPTNTFAPGIDMSYPSGWPRLNKLYEGDTAAMQADIFAAPPVEDSQIASCIRRLREDYGYTIDPHGAVAYRAAEAYDAEAGVPKIVFATGHPAKQLDIMTRITGSAIELPVQLTRFMHGARHHAMIPPTLPALKKQLLMHCKTL